MNMQEPYATADNVAQVAAYLQNTLKTIRINGQWHSLSMHPTCSTQPAPLHIFFEGFPPCGWVSR